MAEERRRQAQRDRDQLTPDEVDEIVQPAFEDPLDRQPVQARPQIVEAVGNVIAAAQQSVSGIQGSLPYDETAHANIIPASGDPQMW